MNLHAYAVIGAGYGDEGKGLMTDYLARLFTKERSLPPIVARANGGAQAGHTVVSQGHRHVFSHIGAGAFNGSLTYLPQAFLVNPIALRDEVVRLKNIGINPKLACSPLARITTIYDMMINQMLEKSRGNARHGSCGMGINETIKRTEAGFGITVGMCTDVNVMAHALHEIKTRWVRRRLEEHGIATMENLGIMESINVELLAHDYISIIRHHLSNSSIHDEYGSTGLPLIIEGAQGLAIDEFLGAFPHVTPTVVGLPSAVLAARECGRRFIKPLYVTRAYATRHGAGPMPHEGEFTPTETDVTNVHNEWQGTLRYGVLDLNELGERIKADYERGLVYAKMFHIEFDRPHLMITCLDQVGEYAEFYWNGKKQRHPKEVFIEAVISHLRLILPITLFGTSVGPSADDVILHTVGN